MLHAETENRLQGCSRNLCSCGRRKWKWRCVFSFLGWQLSRMPIYMLLEKKVCHVGSDPLFPILHSCSVMHSSNIIHPAVRWFAQVQYADVLMSTFNIVVIVRSFFVVSKRSSCSIASRLHVGIWWWLSGFLEDKAERQSLGSRQVQNTREKSYLAHQPVDNCISRIWWRKYWLTLELVQGTLVSGHILLRFPFILLINKAIYAFLFMYIKKKTQGTKRIVLILYLWGEKPGIVLQ